MNGVFGSQVPPGLCHFMLTSEETAEAVVKRADSVSGHQGSAPGPTSYPGHLGQATSLSVPQFPPL